ncbi:MAG: TOM (translocase of outer membrane) complex component [Geoglossum simile]|nr:MAG: TOM (translocase of outer membrane) complex component [Geoglossum simile]
MSAEHVPIPPVRNISVDAPSLSSSTSSSLWDRLSNWVSENKAVVYTVGAVAVVVTGAGVVYLLSESNKGLDSGSSSEEKRKSKKDRRKAKKQPVEEPKNAESDAPRKVPTVEVEKDLPEVDETTVGTLSAQERKDYAAKLKAAGNKAYGSKNYNEAIELYGKAILCKPDPIFYSNRAACYNALGEWQMVVDDTTSALQLDPEYVKALNRRANAYERVERYSEALLDYTASCIIDGFKNEASAHSVERLLKKVAEAKGKAILAEKEKVLPSSTFVTNYLQSFRPRPLPEGLDETADLDEESGKGQLRAGLVAVGLKTPDGYKKAAKHFEKALELGDLGEHEAFAYNMRGTFKYLRGDSADALVDLTKSVGLQPSLTQSFIKRASMHLELEGDREAAAADFTQAVTQNADDPDIYYHRAQLHFICGEYPDAAKDYQKSIDLDKEFIFSHIQLGVTQYKMGSIASSMATFRRCIKNFDKVPDVYNYYGELLLDQQKYQEAIEKFDTAVEMENQSKSLVHMNVLPLINKALALFQWKKDFGEAEKLCEKALIIDPECDIAVATMAQLLLQQGKVPDALTYFERAAELSRTEGEIVNALSYAEATRTQLEVYLSQSRLGGITKQITNRYKKNTPSSPADCKGCLSSGVPQWLYRGVLMGRNEVERGYWDFGVGPHLGAFCVGSTH